MNIQWVTGQCCGRTYVEDAVESAADVADVVVEDAEDVDASDEDTVVASKAH